MKFVAKILSASLLLAAAAPFASADTLNVVGANSYGAAIAGATISATATNTFIAPGTGVPFTAQYTETVYRGGTNTLAFCATCVNFVYSFSNAAVSGTDTIDISTMLSFGSFLTNEGYVANTGAVRPGSVDRSGTKIAFSFVGQGGVAPGSATDTLVVFTNATNYTLGTLLFQDGTQANGPAYLPAAAPTGTPEPSSLALLGTGIAGLGGLVRRRIKRA